MNSRVKRHEMAHGPGTIHRLPTSRWGGAHLGTAFVAALAFAATACGGNGGPSAEKVAVQWRTADHQGHFETSWELEAPELAGPKDKKTDTIDRRRRFFKPHTPGDELASVEVTRTVEDDTQKEDFVFVYLRLTDKEGDVDDEVVTLRRVGGEWRVAKWEP